MSKTTAFLISFLFYISIFSLFMLELSTYQKSIQYGNSSVDILLTSEDSKEKEAPMQDYTKEIAKHENIVKEKPVNNEEKKPDSDIADLNNLFNDLKITKPKSKLRSKDAQEKINNIKNTLKSTTVKSNNNNKISKSNQISGIYDEYFTKVNSYLKNMWNLITQDANGIDNKEFVEVDFDISKDGIIKLHDSNLITDTILKQKAKIFIDKINQENKNLGIPPMQQVYKGIIRLSVVLNIKEIK